jgi:hypothetical protein
MNTRTIILDDLADDARRRLGLLPGDPELFRTLLDFMRRIARSTSLEQIIPHLHNEDDPLCVWRLKWPFIYCLREGYVSAFDASGKYSVEYADWVEAFGYILLKIAKLTKQYDPWIQHILNFEDFLYHELQHVTGGQRVVCEFYDIRGIDFFLVHYFGGQTTAVSDTALFESSRIVPKCLRATGREEEAGLVEREIDEREKRLREIATEYSPPHAVSLAGTLDRLRLLAERFWVDYLSSEVWALCCDTSRQDLVDAFVAEYMLQNGVLKGWSQAVLSLCKVIEREMASVFFLPWIGHIGSASFDMPENLSHSQTKRAQSRQITFQVLQSCSRQPSHPPTLGQLLFVGKFWCDSVMDQCTNLFREMRETADRSASGFSNTVAQFVKLCEETHEVDGEHPTVMELRNAAAHPGRESDFTWPEYVGWLKEFLGKPPREALRLLIQMREALNPK